MNKESSSNIRSALEYYDNHQLEIIELLKKIEYIKFINNAPSTNQIIFFDSDKKILLESNYESLGFYFQTSNIWRWAWSMPTLSKNDTLISRKILNYAFDLEPTKEYILRSALINSKILIKNNLQLDINIALSSYLIKKPFIFKLPIGFNDNSKDDYISYKNIFTHKSYDKFIISYLYILDYNIK
jgi:hypothetical protein